MKRKLILCVAASAMVFVFPTNGLLHAADYASNEDYYQNLCRVEPKNSECPGFRTYLNNKQQGLLDEVASMKDNMASIQSNINSIQDAINSQQKTIDGIAALIDENNAAIARIDEAIIVLDGVILQTEADIEKRDETIKQRMVSEQGKIGTNIYAEFVMGAKDLVDMIRIASGIEQITANDQNEIEALEADKAKLNEQKETQKTLKEEQELTKSQNEQNKAAAEEAKKYQEELMSNYLQQEAELNEQMRSASAAASAVGSKIIALNSVSYEPSDGWMVPTSGYKTAGTFYYPGGGFHAGLDFGTPVGTPLYAPIGGVVVYANNPVSSNSGYLGNWSGYPAGGGNTIHMVGTVNGTTYGVSFFHLSQESFSAYAGMAVSQGTFLAATGHSGNSSGAHVHIEIINLGSITSDEAITRFRNNPDFAWGTGWSSESTSCNSKGSAPCREKPESFFGY